MSVRGLHVILMDLQKALNGYHADVPYCRCLVNEAIESYRGSLVEGFFVKFDETKYPKGYWMSETGQSTDSPFSFSGINHLIKGLSGAATMHPKTGRYGNGSDLRTHSDDRYLPPKYADAVIIFPDKSSQSIQEFLVAEGAKLKNANAYSFGGDDKNIRIKIPGKNKVSELVDGKWTERDIAFKYYRYPRVAASRTEYYMNGQWVSYRPYGHSGRARVVPYIKTDYSVYIWCDENGVPLPGQEELLAAEPVENTTS